MSDNKIPSNAKLSRQESKSNANKNLEDLKNTTINGTCNSNQSEELTHTLLQLQILKVSNNKNLHKSAVALWDAGSTLCFVTFDLAKELQLQGNPITLDITTVGGGCSKVNSQKYAIWIEDENGN